MLSLCRPSLFADTIPKSRRVYDLIRKLTCDHLDGMPQSTTVRPAANGRTYKSGRDFVEAKIRREEQMGGTQEQ